MSKDAERRVKLRRRTRQRKRVAAGYGLFQLAVQATASTTCYVLCLWLRLQPLLNPLASSPFTASSLFFLTPAQTVSFPATPRITWCCLSSRWPIVTSTGPRTRSLAPMKQIGLRVAVFPCLGLRPVCSSTRECSCMSRPARFPIRASCTIDIRWHLA